MPSVRIIVRGRVQGVGFRAFVQTLGLGLGLKGEVWNRTDGAVEAHATGAEQAIAALVEALRNGPGRVDEVIAMPTDLASTAVSFIIGYTR